MGDKGRAQYPLGFAPHIIDGLHHLDAARLAASTSMNLRLHHPDRSAQCFSGLHRLIHRESGDAFRHRHAVTFQNLLGLVFVDVHAVSPKASSRYNSVIPAKAGTH